jgi:1-acyl-sn-glycerol-3-phosphate acyltransferase
MLLPAQRLGVEIGPLGPPHGRVSLALRVVAIVATLLLLSLVYIAICLVLLPSRRLRVIAGNAYGKAVGASSRRLLGIRTVVHHRERLVHPAVWAMNHASWLDALVGMWLCPWGGAGVGKKEVVRVPLFGWAYRLSGHPLIDRGDHEAAVRSLREAGDFARNKRIGIFVYPEGTRSRDGRLGPLRKGVVHLALQTRFPVVPVVAHSVQSYWPRDGFRIRPGILHVEVLEPIPTDDWSEDRIDEHLATLRNAMLRALGQDEGPAAAAAAQPAVGAAPAP